MYTPTISFTIPGIPIAKARPRFGRNRKTGGMQVYTPDRTAAYEKKVKALALVARQEARQRCWTGAVGVEVFFYVAHPKKRPDCDNLLKTLLDACKGVIFEDDAQLTSVAVKKLSLPAEKELKKALKNGADHVLLGKPRTVVTFWSQSFLEKSVDAKLAMAINPTTPADVLNALAADEDTYVRETVAHRLLQTRMWAQNEHLHTTNLHF